MCPPVPRVGKSRASPDRSTKKSPALSAAQQRLRRECAQHRKTRSAALEAERRYQLLLTQSRRMQAELRHLTQKALTALEDERRKISRELHDDVIQLLAGISVQLATLTMEAKWDERILKRKIARTCRLVEKSIEAVHHFARDLRPAVLDDLGLVPAIRSFVQNLRTARPLDVRITAFPNIENLTKDKRTVLFRVTQEALLNIARHAHARNAEVRIRQEGAFIALDVRDDGVSFDVVRVLTSRRRHQLGLLGMRERVEMVGGTFAITSIPGRGTHLHALVPIHREAASS